MRHRTDRPRPPLCARAADWRPVAASCSGPLAAVPPSREPVQAAVVPLPAPVMAPPARRCLAARSRCLHREILPARALAAAVQASVRLRFAAEMELTPAV